MATVPGIAEDPVDALFRVLPEDFVAERRTVVKALRASGDRERAMAVGKLRRPSLAEWALNQVAHDDPEVVDRLLAAVDAVRAAQAGAISGAAGDLRTANEERRLVGADLARRAEAVLGQHGRDPAPQAAAIGDVLRGVGTSSALAEQLRAGRLGSAPAAEEDPFVSLEPASTTTAPSRTGPPPAATRRGAPADERTSDEPPPDELARRRRERAVATAQHALDKAQQAFERAERREAEAAAAVEEQQARLERAEQTYARAQSERAERADALQYAEEQLRAAQES